MGVFQNKKNLAMVLVMLCGLIALGYVFLKQSFFPTSTVVTIGERQWNVDLAATPALRELGLGSREALPSGTGTLFLFPDSGPARHAFWMKGMRFPLDIAWIFQGRIIFLERNIPADSRDIFRPLTEADMVLEVNASELDGVAIGDLVKVHEKKGD